MEDRNHSETHRGSSPPYTSFQSVKTMAKQMQQNGLPSRIDRSVLTNFSGAVGGQLITALKFLKLTDASGHPTDELRALVESYGTDDWAEKLAAIVREAYQPIFELDLESATPSQFTERFRSVYPGTEEVSRKSITFFLNAAQDCGLKISPYILKNKKPRSTSQKSRKLTKNGMKASRRKQTPESLEDNERKPNAKKDPSELLLGLLNPTEMQEKEMDAIWTLLQYFKAKGE